MTTQSIACRSCGADVPYGRLACPSCGELFASVAGAGRRVVIGSGATGPADDARTVDVPSESVHEIESVPATDDVQAFETPAAEPDDAVSEAPASPWVTEDATDLADIDDGLPIPTPVSDPAIAATAFVPAVLQPAELDPMPPVPVEPEWRLSAEPVVTAPAATWAPREPLADPIAAGHGSAPMPGAYVPPVAAGPAAPARTWASPSTGGTAAAAAATAGAGSPGTTASPTLAVAPERLDEWARSLAVVGGAIATAGFVLPWAATVIGATGIGFFDRWGLAGPGHILVVIGLLAIIALAMLRNPIPMWLRVGVPSLVGGALVLGLAWPYLWSDVLGRTVGVFVVATGAVLLMAAGVLALAGARHATPTTTV